MNDRARKATGLVIALLLCYGAAACQRQRGSALAGAEMQT